ncbi:c-type cytochrome [Tunicatimonas pelagia]|uniref:c-type cytochrome n=1 Tax=Tunicatimonas pelagia TaxID=931531 RepID=UPI00266513BE|nr:cytochrome c [Tunicatimonas pelagia]WKN43641.1 cytochrome c [Tunicatimonas pelagia]
MKNLAIFFTLGWLLFACSGGTQTEQSSESVAEPEPEKMSAEALKLMAVGNKVYGQYCIACHQTDGKGVPGAFPTLVQTEWVNGDNTRLISVVLNGLQGEITVNGETYNGVMTPHGFLTDEEVAGVLTYVRQSFGNDAKPISAEEVAEVRASNTEAGT